MRIIAGDYRGRALASVGKGDAGAHLRPTTDRVRESLFNVLMGGAYGDPITDARVLDLFAGTGALGLEALSRGAAQVTFVDDGRKALGLIKENIALCRAQDEARIFRSDARRLGTCKETPFDLIFLDPPYATDYLQKAVTILPPEWLEPRALIYCEANVALETLDVPDSLRWYKRATAGRVNYGLLQLI